MSLLGDVAEYAPSFCYKSHASSYNSTCERYFQTVQYLTQQDNISAWPVFLTLKLLTHLSQASIFNSPDTGSQRSQSAHLLITSSGCQLSSAQQEYTWFRPVNTYVQCVTQSRLLNHNLVPNLILSLELRRHLGNRQTLTALHLALTPVLRKLNLPHRRQFSNPNILSA